MCADRKNIMPDPLLTHHNLCCLIAKGFFLREGSLRKSIIMRRPDNTKALCCRFDTKGEPFHHTEKIYSAILFLENATHYSLIADAWSVKRETIDGPLPSQCSDREESLIVVTHSRDGESAFTQYAIGREPLSLDKVNYSSSNADVISRSLFTDLTAKSKDVIRYESVEKPAWFIEMGEMQ